MPLHAYADFDLGLTFGDRLFFHQRDGYESVDVQLINLDYDEKNES